MRHDGYSHHRPVRPGRYAGGRTPPPAPVYHAGAPPLSRNGPSADFVRASPHALTLPARTAAHYTCKMTARPRGDFRFGRCVTMRRPRFSIAAILCATALVRSLFAGSRPLSVSSRFGLLMTNVLPAAGYSLWAWRGRGRVRPFLLGFVAAGVTAALGCQAAYLVAFPASDGHQARVAPPSTTPSAASAP